jgi:hypothetical protein
MVIGSATACIYELSLIEVPVSFSSSRSLWKNEVDLSLNHSPQGSGTTRASQFCVLRGRPTIVFSKDDFIIASGRSVREISPAFRIELLSENRQAFVISGFWYIGTQRAD